MDDVDDPLLGTTVAGRFRLVERIGKGGMGAVYRAVQSPLERECALKLIRNDVVDALARKRFEREARIAASIDDPRVATVYDFGSTDDGTLFLAMELVHGVTLRERLQQGPLPWLEAARVVREVARALGAAHSRGLVHRDLKPENIMLASGAVGRGSNGPDGGARVKVLDFGLAKEIADLAGINATATSLTRAGAFVGTPGYVAPETLKGAGEDPRQDVFGLGVLLWECLAGDHPFAADTPLETIVRSMQEDLPPLAESKRRHAGAPPEVSALLASLCARDPHERPKDGDDVAARIDALQAQTASFPSSLSSLSSLSPLSSLTSLSPLHELTGEEARLPAGAVRKSDADVDAAPIVSSRVPKRAPFESLDPEEVTEPNMTRSQIGRIDAVAAALANKSSSSDAPRASASNAPSPSRSRWRTVVAASGACAIIAIVSFVFVSFVAPSRAPDGDEATTLALARAETALASGNAASARVQLRDVLLHDDGPRVRALWSAARRADRVVDMAIEGRVTGVSFVDAHHVAVANRNTTIDVVDVRSGARAKLRGHADEVVAVSASPSGELASCDILGDVRRWRGATDMKGGGESQSRKPSDRRCYGVHFAGDTLWITDGAVARWGAARPPVQHNQASLGVIGIDAERVIAWGGALLFVFEGDAERVLDRVDVGSPVRSLTVATSSATTTATASATYYAGLVDGRVLRFALASASMKIGAMTTVRKHGARVEALAVSRDGKLLASAGNNEAVRIGPVEGAARIALVDGPRAPIALAFSPDGAHLAVVARDRLVVYDVSVLVDERRASDAHRRTVEALDIESNGGAVWTGGADGSLIRWDTATARGRVQLRVDATIEDLDIAPDDGTVALALSDGRAFVVDAHTGEERGGWIHPGGATAVAFDDDGALLVSGGRDGRIYVAGPDRVQSLVGTLTEGNAALSIAIGGPRDRRVVATGGERGALHVFEARAGGRELFRALLSKCGSVFALRIDALGVLAPCNDGRLELRRFASLDESEDAAFAETRIYDVDARGDVRVVSGSLGAWLSEPRAKGTLRQVSQQRNVNRARIDRAGAALYTASDDTTVRRIALDDMPDAWDLDAAHAVGRDLDGFAALRSVRLLDANEHFVCVVDARGLHAWSADGRAREVTVPDAPVTAVAATTRGCVVATPRGARFTVDGNEVARTTDFVSAVASSGDDVILAVGRELVFTDAHGVARNGARRIMLPEGATVSALTSSSTLTLAGRADGTAVLVDGDQVHALDVSATHAVTAVALLPSNVVALGHEDGTVRVLASGVLIDSVRLHGAVAHLAFTPAGLVASTSLGDADVRVGALDDERCQLFGDVAHATGIATPCN